MRKSTSVISVTGIIAVIFLIMGFVKGAESKKMIARCTESVPGVVVDVDSKRVRSGRSSHTEYSGTVKYTPKGVSEPTIMETYWTSSKLNVGEKTIVHYDPASPYIAYTDRVRPEGSAPSFFTAGVSAVIGAVVFVVNRAKGD